MIDVKAVIAEIDSVLAEYEAARPSSKYDDLSDLSRGVKNQILTIFAAAIERLAPPSSAYRKAAEAAYLDHGRDNGHNITIQIGILRALRADYEKGRMRSITELIHGEMFADFLEMAGHLHAEGYKDAAAVVAGSMLESHLRALCDKNGIPTNDAGRPKKADLLNAELAKAQILGKLDQKNVTAWLDLRNKAAHGQYQEYTREQVGLLIDSIRDFVGRHVA